MLCPRVCWIENSDSCHGCQCKYTRAKSETPLSEIWNRLVEISRFQKRQCHSQYNLSRNLEIRRPYGVSHGVICKYFLDETKLIEHGVLLWSCWDPLSHVCTSFLCGGLRHLCVIHTLMTQCSCWIGVCYSSQHLYSWTHSNTSCQALGSAVILCIVSFVFFF